MSVVKNNEMYRKLSNETQGNFGKMQPLGKFLNSNARIMIEVIDDETLRITYRSLVHYASPQMLPIVTEVEYKTARKAAEDLVENIAKKVDAKISLREELVNEYMESVTSMLSKNRQAYYRWSVIADVKE